MRILILILSALVLREAWILIPESSNTFDPYPYFDAQVSRQYYFYFAFYYASNLLFVYTFYEVIKDHKEFFHLWFALQTVELIDYFLTYNNAWFKVGAISVGITLVKLVTLTVTILVLWYRSYSRK